jgi:hypothetical protein
MPALPVKSRDYVLLQLLKVDQKVTDHIKIETRSIFLLVCLLFAACSGRDSPAPEATPAPWEPLSSDAEMERVEIENVEVEIISLEGDPSRSALHVEGALPTPCHLLRVEVSSSDDQNSLAVEIYAVVDPNEICIQVLEPFSVNIPLDEGEYQVIVNNEVVGELTP